MVLHRFADPLTMAGKRCSVGWQDQVYIQLLEFSERCQEFVERIAAGKPPDIEINQLQYLICRKEDTELAIVEAHVAGRVPRWPNHFEFSVRHRNLFTACQQAIG